VVVENRGDRYVRYLELAVNITDDDGGILNTARYELVREADLNIAPGERMAVPLQVYPKKEGRAELLVEEIDVGIPTDRSVERTPLEVVLTGGAAVDSLAGVLEHRLRYQHASRRSVSVIFQATNVSQYTIDKLTYCIAGDGLHPSYILGARREESGPPFPHSSPARPGPSPPPACSRVIHHRTSPGGWSWRTSASTEDGARGQDAGRLGARQAGGEVAPHVAADVGRELQRSVRGGGKVSLSWTQKTFSVKAIALDFRLFFAYIRSVPGGELAWRALRFWSRPPSPPSTR
jgi:hypothetical protein